MELAHNIQSLGINETEESPVNFQHYTVVISGYNTDIAQHDFSNCSVLIVSQYGKLGSVLKISVDRSDDGLLLDEPIYSVRAVFGNVTVEQEAAARHIAEKLGVRKELTLFLCLRDYEVQHIRALVQVLKAKWQY